MNQNIVVIECLFRCSFISIRPPYSFQVKETLPMPIGTTLYGAFIYGLLNLLPELSHGAPISGESTSIYNYVNKIYNELIKYVSITCRYSNKSITSISSFTWRTIRYDRGIDPREAIESQERGTPLECIDAMIKISSFTTNMIISIALPKEITLSIPNTSTSITLSPQDVERSMYFIPRFGDTESLCSCIKCYVIKSVDLLDYEANDVIEDVSTVTIIGTPYNRLFEVSRGNTIITIFNNIAQGLYYASKPNYALYALPLHARTTIIRGRVITFYEPSTYSLRSLIKNVKALKYESPIDDTKVTHIYIPSYINYFKEALEKAPKYVSTRPTRRGRRSRR